ncbi:aldehyde dehydrogenase family protein [Calidifontibacillus oryziterrae]|uniref:aldehyde dehydrogenase family protein n=1 Tax=Calidifontibacillus oryziterrae TaxID=1191699 RepID=UPI0002E0DF79|nr:aldehyde dehydrogenase family protein [Calidifontibacillus oryziterrae]
MAIQHSNIEKLFINGEWIEAEQVSPLQSPYSGELLAEIPVATVKDVKNAIAAAEAARKKLRNMAAHERAAILERISAIFAERADEAAEIIAKESAKPITTAKGEVARTILTYKFAAEEAKRIYGETLPMDAAPGGENRFAYTIREPIGVIAAITPFNFPMNLVAHKVGPAIAAGNPVVLKPASQTPLSAIFLAKVAEEAGMPKGALNVVTGRGSVIGDALVTDDRVKMVTFTGSPAVGIGLRNKAGLKRVTLELGSNSAVIIDEGVTLTPTLISRCITGAFSNQGQVCISVQRVYVHVSQYDEFVSKFVEQTKQLTLGDPLDPNTDVSALISANDVDRAKRWIDDAVTSGALVAVGGEIIGNMLQPTVLLNVKNDVKISCQEVFAPVVIINKISSVEEAVALVNDSAYGLQAGIFTNNIHVAMDAAEDLEVGGVLINDIPTYRVDHMPYGGVKNSGFGREGLKYAIEEMTEMKLVIINRNK